MLALDLVQDSLVNGRWFDDPLLFLYTDNTAQSYCPCFAYHERKGTWKEVGDSVYAISLTEQLNDYFYMLSDVDSAATDSGVVFKFVNPKGKSIKKVKLKIRGDSTVYTTNANGILYFPFLPDTYRYEIDIPKYKKGFKRTNLVNPNPNMAYIFYLLEPHNSYTLYYMLKKEGAFWVLYTEDYKKVAAYFYTYRGDPYDK